MSVIVDGTNGLIFNDASTQTTAATSFGFKNRVINGDMKIAQRGTSSFTVDNGNWYYPVDRFSAYQSVASSKFTIQRNEGSVTPPPGFKYYIGAVVTSAYTPTGGDWFPIRHTIEGHDWADFEFGTANAKTFTASFWVRSSLTGTLGGAFYNNDGSRSYPFTYTISSANTWEYKTIVVAGDTGGTWNTTNNGGITIQWSMGGGSTYTGTAGAWASAFYVTATGATHPVATNGATLYITGVQIEKGSTATTFDYRDYGSELARCQRYYQQYSSTGDNSGFLATGYCDTSSRAFIVFQFPVHMRTAPSLTVVSATSFGLYNVPADTVSASSISLLGSATTVSGAAIIVNSSGVFTAGRGTVLKDVGSNASGRLQFNAEL